MSQTATYRLRRCRDWGELLIPENLSLLLVKLAHEQIAQQQTNHPAGGVVADGHTDPDEPELGL